jgi:hypothetical protein
MKNKKSEIDLVIFKIHESSYKKNNKAQSPIKSNAKG